MNMSDYFRAGSALREFLAGRLGAPECWPNDYKGQPAVTRLPRTKHLTSDAYGHTHPARGASFNRINK
jgi:hypothetical protein